MVQIEIYNSQVKYFFSAINLERKLDEIFHLENFSFPFWYFILLQLI